MIKKLAIILTALLLCSCSNNQTEEVTSATSDFTITTSVISEPKPEISENQQKITELELDLNNDGINEKIVLKPDAENDNSRLYCYDSNGILIGIIDSASADWCAQMSELNLKWFDDGENIYPALLSTYGSDFFYGDYTLKLYINDGKFCVDRILQTGGLRENYGSITDPDYYSDIYGGWISETQYNNYKAMIYDNIEDTPNYKKSMLIKEAVGILTADGIIAESDSAYLADADGDGTDELLIIGMADERRIYCFKNIGGKLSEDRTSDIFTAESYALEWYNDRKEIFPVARVTDENDDRLYKLALDDSGFSVTLIARRHILPDGDEYTKSNGEHEISISEKKYLTLCYFTWKNKENRLNYVVNVAAEFSKQGMLYDVNEDGVPELICGYKNYEFMDTECSVCQLDSPIINSIGGMYMDEDSCIKRYYDIEKDEYFFITEYCSYGITCTSSNTVDKTVFYKNDSVTEELASELYYFDRFSSENSDKFFLDNYTFMDKEITKQEFVSNTSQRAYSSELENYLADYRLVDSINVSDLINTHSEDIRNDYEKQALAIEKKYLCNPTESAIQTKPEQILFNGEYVNINTKYLDIDVHEPIAASEFEKLTGIENLTGLYIYNAVTNDSNETTLFDLDLLNCCADKITNLDFYNVEIDVSKLKNFKNLKSLGIYNQVTTSDLSEIGKLTQLTSLYIDCGFEEEIDLSALAHLTNIKCFSISGKIKNFNFAKNMNNLNKVYFYGESDYVDCFKTLSELPNLKVIEFSGFGPALKENQMDCFADRDDMIFPSLK